MQYLSFEVPNYIILVLRSSFITDRLSVYVRLEPRVEHRETFGCKKLPLWTVRRNQIGGQDTTNHITYMI